MALNYAYSINNMPKNLVRVLLYNSITVAVGDAVTVYTNGYATNGVAATPLFGVVQAITTKNGQPVIKGDPTAGSANTSDTTSVTTAATNTTTQTYWALVDTSKHSVYSAAVSGTLGTTVSSTLPGCRIDINSANTTYGQLLESTATRTVATPANFYSWGVDPNDSTRLLVSIALSEAESI